MDEELSFEWCVKFYDNAEGDGEPLYHTHLETDNDDLHAAAATAATGAIMQNVSLKDAKLVLVTFAASVDPVVAGRQEQARAELHGRQAQEQQAQPSHNGGHRLH